MSTTRNTAVANTADASAVEIWADLQQWVERLPEFEGGDGSAIIGAILATESLSDLIGEDTGGLPSAADLCDKAPWNGIVTHLYRMPSDIVTAENPFPYYVIARGLDDAGNEVMFNTGAASVMTKLTLAFGKFHVAKVRVRIAKSEKTTRAGYRPLNIAILSADPTL